MSFDKFLKPKYCSNERTKSLIKWAGGKGRVLPALSPYFDLRNIEDKTYYEPFCGSCAVAFFHDQDNMHLNDKNHNLINFFMQVKCCPEKLFKSIHKLIVQ